MLSKQYYVYLLAHKENGTLYIGVTNYLIRRMHQHKQKLLEGFTKTYSIHKLVYYEIHTDVHQALLREKQLKKWKRQWKIKLIEKQNPHWIDLTYELIS